MSRGEGGRKPADTTPEAEDRGIFADPLNQLYARTGASDTTVATALHEAGIRVTAQYLGQIRNGKRQNVGSDVVRGLESYFDLPPGYFYRSAGAAEVESDPFVKAVGNPEIAALALRAGELSPRGLAYLKDLVEQVHKWEAAARSGPGADDRDG
jgi:hypothetical protein